MSNKSKDKGFNKWYSNIADKFGYSKNPDDPLHFYDYRTAYKEGVREPSKFGHWPSKYKDDLHYNRYIPIGGAGEEWWDTKYEKKARIDDIMIWKEKRSSLLQQVDYWQSLGEPNV